MVQKRLLCPERVRKIPKQFSWIDQRLVREGHIERLSHRATALYLFLVTVADARGLSYYSDPASPGGSAWKPAPWITPARNWSGSVCSLTKARSTRYSTLNSKRPPHAHPVFTHCNKSSSR